MFEHSSDYTIFFANFLVHAHIRPHVFVVVWLEFLTYFTVSLSSLSGFSMEILEKLLDNFNSVKLCK